ncbi:MAG: zinc-dependent peptidase [Myxococcota bacterium]
MRTWPVKVVRWHMLAGGILTVVVGAAAGYIVSPWAALVGLAVGAGYLGWSTRRYVRRKRMVATPFPEAWRTILEGKVPFFRRLPEAGKRRFQDDVRIFVSEHRIAGLRGAPVSDDVQLLIGASAAMLTFGMPDWEWPRMRDIVVYPGSFDEEYAIHGGGTIAGMVHAQGPILLSEKALRHGFARPSDGQHVGLHELAHVMDFVNGAADGIPAAHDWVSTAPWVELMAERLVRVRSEQGQRVLRSYAGKNEAELFAVAVEVFFEKPAELRKLDPELFAMLEDYFGYDPEEPSMALSSLEP